MQLKLTKKQATVLCIGFVLLMFFWVYFYQIKFIAIDSIDGILMDEFQGDYYLKLEDSKIDFWSPSFVFKTIPAQASDIRIGEYWDSNTLVVMGKGGDCSHTVFDNMDMFQFKVNEYDEDGTPKIITYSGQMIDINCNGAIYEF